MATFEWIIVLLLGAALLAALARRLGAPYPTFLALGGTLLAFVPDSPNWTLDPHLALTLFVAPVLVDAAYDTSLRDLRTHWRPIAGLVIAAVGTTVIAVALVARWLVPGMSWPVAIALGAIVAPPDAAAATAVMRQVKLPHKLLKIIEGESLLNDASALLVYRLAIMAVMAGHLGFASFAPVFLLTLFGSLAAGVGCAWALRRLMSGVREVPVLLIMQFALTFGVWIAAEAIGLSGILTLVAYAMTVARSGGAQLPARQRVPVFAVWEAVVFVLNAFAFVLIGMQLRPIWQRLEAGGARTDAVLTALVVLGTTVAARFVWVMSYKALSLRRHRAAGAAQAGHGRGAFRSGIVLSWAGMRGIVTLAAAFAIPETLPDGTPFPHRDLILLCAFAVVLGTLVLQGLTMAPLIRRMGLSDDDPVGREIRLGRTHAYRALLDAIAHDDSLAGKLLRKEYGAIVELNSGHADEAPIDEVPGGPLRRRAIAVARQRAFEMRRDDVIGDDAYRVLVQELDWAELSAGGGRPQ
ncbi:MULTISPECIES: Na+/H+ antiporter [Variovorax]|uniref:Na+/H+ antiporter n=1 Tax=Variovorax ginsengisoli TaxID=363844 RepID=A0ABT8SE49_9BURK|nr:MULTISPECIES: Na+/H+ antiporter [Variovorax]MDM0083566.1 Na+/H+ antiporter [Variovorax sp. J31P179]MDN8617102.1 Na+/H+ antiporter [Variovorax ginsengisoli]MDO1536272.1 Na+/H+ antiporter [Variovorax ginsengisoli]HET7834813.1 Na+/H+ antiporter [Variovorax sp.]